MHERMRGDLQGAAVQQQVQAGAEMIEKVPIPGLRPTVWDQTQQKVKYPKLLRKAVTDVVVVGAGIAGLTVAYNLVKEGKKVVVLESRVRGKIDRDDDQIWQQTWYFSETNSLMQQGLPTGWEVVFQVEDRQAEPQHI